MRCFKLFVVVTFLIAIQGCKSKPYPTYMPEIEYLSKVTNGVVIIRSSGLGIGMDAAVEDAQKNVFYHIIFKGFPGTELNIPMIDNESVAKENHKQYFKMFFEQGGYKSFMLSSNLSSNLSNVSNGQKIIIDVKVNCNSLRKELEQNQVIRKFGF